MQVSELQRAAAGSEQSRTTPFTLYDSAHTSGRTEEDARQSEARRHRAKVAEVGSASCAFKAVCMGHVAMEHLGRVQ